jgi:hypothetical protein
MGAIGGSIESVSIRGRSFAVASDADAQVKLGGFQNEVQPNGDGSARTIKTRAAWSITGLQLEIQDARGDQEFLQEIQDGLDDVSITITYASGVTRQGQGTVVDEVQYSTQNATASVSFGGPGSLTQQ